MQYPENISLVRTKNNILNIRHHNQNLLIGFSLKCHAVEVRKYVHLNSSMKLSNYVTTDRATEMNDMLHNRGIFNVNITSMNISENAHLTISKKININKTNCNIEQIPLSEFIMYPFSKNLGIVIAHDLINENKNEFIFESQIVEASNNTDMFLFYLKKQK